MKTNCLVEIPSADWQKLADLYSSDKTIASGWNCLRNYIHWLRVGDELDFLKFYSLNSDWSDGTFIIQAAIFPTVLYVPQKTERNEDWLMTSQSEIHGALAPRLKLFLNQSFDLDVCEILWDLVDGISIMFNTLDSNHDRLLLALDCIQSLEQFKNVTYICICDFSHRYKNVINKYMEPTGIQIDLTAAWLHIEQDKALNFQIDVPPKTYLKSLDKSHIATVNSLWAYQYPGSEDFIGRLIHFNVSFGIFDESGNLMGWCLQLPRGSLGLLQVRDEYKRRGYGSLIVRAMSKRLAEMGTEVTAAAVDSNVASRKMFENLGFREIDTIHWVCRPMKET